MNEFSLAKPLPLDRLAATQMADSGQESLEVRISVDAELCSGTGYCARLMPEVFVLRGGQAIVRDGLTLAGMDLDMLRETARSCPWFAIAVEVVEPAD